MLFRLMNDSRPSRDAAAAAAAAATVIVKAVTNSHPSIGEKGTFFKCGGDHRRAVVKSSSKSWGTAGFGRVKRGI